MKSKEKKGRMLNPEEKYYNSLEEMYLDNYKVVNAFIRDYFSDEEMVKDMASMVWLKVTEHFDRFAEMDSRWIKNYLRVVVRNMVTDHLRKQSKAKQIQEELAFLPREDYEESRADAKLFAQEKEKYLKQAVSALSYEDRLFIYMRYGKKITSEEIGRLMGMTGSGVRMKQARLLKRLKEEITKLIEEDNEKT